MDTAEDKFAQAQQESHTPTRGFFEKFVRGEFGLAKTYWLGAAVPTGIVGIAIRHASSATLAFWLGALFVCYQFLLVKALWNAGTRYEGSRIWPGLALLMVIGGLVRNFGAVLDLARL
ncbi:hypothetical protein IP92_02087 [Pseudoduganella flava]|uniref:DUF805 domain-containing protein n=2 Tax=Pseudoduganella flava TaxID=871742 RepID=A0A562PW96_9BURK|nr:hypothetical protein [Pseudoduganella flava]QGZ39779.1 hypothetical protein GO485_12440 [Pseudoduganella flava]TWI48695.1 hypothetical protein IP92_02087 [Pseudoduganella flava]